MNKKSLLTIASIGSFVTASVLAIATSLQVSAQTVSDRYECYGDAIANHHIAVADSFETYTAAIATNRRIYAEDIREIYYLGPLRETGKEKREEALQKYKTAVADAKVVYTEERTVALVNYKDDIEDCRNLGKNASITLVINGPAAKEVENNAKNIPIANVNISTDNAAVHVNTFYALVEFLNGQQAAEFRAKEAVETIALKDMNSGTLYEGTYVFDATVEEQGKAVYRFDNSVNEFTITGSKQYQVLYSLTDNGPQAASKHVRVHLCATEHSKECTFGGRTQSSYPMSVTTTDTNKELDIVRPNTVISSNAHTIKEGDTNTEVSLTVAVESLSTTDTSVKNQKDINLLRFTARSQGEDILLTSVDLTSAAGNLLNAQNYTLLVDTDNDQAVDAILESGRASTNSQNASLNDLTGGGYVLKKDTITVFEIHADVASSLQDDNTLQIQIAENGIKAEVVSNNESLGNDNININRSDSTLFTFASQGDLFITLDERLQSRQLLGGTITDEVLRLNFAARNEDIKVEDLRFTVEGNPDVILSLELYQENQTNPFGAATTNNCPAGSPAGTFCFSSQDPKLVIPQSSDVDVSVRARIKKDTNGGLSNQDITISLQTSIGDILSVQAEGLQSSNELPKNDGNEAYDGEIFIGTTNNAESNRPIPGQQNKTVMSKIVSITNANPAADNSAVPIGVTPAGQFRFTAASHTNAEDGLNDVVLDEIVFTVVASNVQLNADGFNFYNKSDPTSKIPCEASGTTGNITVRCKDLIDGHIDQGNGGCFEIDDETICTPGAALLLEVDTEIDQGTSATFVLETEVENAGSNSILQVSLRNFSNDPFIPNADVVESNLYWVDKDALTFERFNYVEYPETVVNSTTYKNN